jgi:hypothetical protein
MVLGIIGGALSLVGALSSIAIGIVMNSEIGFFADLFNKVYSGFFNITADTWGIVMIVCGAAQAICGVLGLVSGLTVKKKNITAGVLMIIAAVVSLLITGWLAMILFTLGGVFALVKEKPPVPPLPQPPVQ